MAVYTTVTQEDLEKLKRNYGFATLPTASPIAEGVENTNYLLSYEVDGHPARAILTVFEARVNEAEVPFFLLLKEHLHGKRIPCPVPYRGRAGEMTLTLHGKTAAVVSFLEGSSVHQPLLSHCRQAGEMLARLHKAALDFPMARANSMSFEGWEELRRRIALRRHEIQPSELFTTIEEALKYARAQWPDNLPSGVIHADFFPNNVFFDAGGQLSGVIDFYFACNDLLAYDLAIVINAWCFDEHAHFNPELFQALLGGYERVRALNVHEKAALPALLGIAALRFLLTRLHDQLYHDPQALVTPHDPLHYARIMEYHAHHSLVGS